MASRNVSQRILLTVSLFALIVITLIPAPVEAKAGNSSTLPDLASFVQSVTNGEPNQLRGVYVPDLMALSVAQQPTGNAGFVSQDAQAITQFAMVNSFGNIGLLAHNHLAGQYFPSLMPGNTVYLVYGNGTFEAYIVTQILRYQAYEPYSPYSRFSDLNSGIEYSAEDVFRQAYMGEHHVTFQTCIAKNGEPSWGRLFVIAIPLTQYEANRALKTTYLGLK